jgi:hypothetical protein
MRARIVLPVALVLAAAVSSAERARSQQPAIDEQLRQQLQQRLQQLQPSPQPQTDLRGGALLRPEAERFVQQSPQGQAQQGQQGNRQTLCRGAQVPAGWIIVDYDRDRTRCGGDNPAALNAFNIVVMERFDNRGSGTTMEICAATPTPAGWTMVDVFRDNRRCGRPTAPFEANVKRIRKS